MSDPLRVAIDVTPLLGRATGVGVLVQSIVAGMAGRPSEVSAVGFALSLRGRRRLADVLPPGMDLVAPAWPAGGLHRLWQRVDRPRAEALLGPHDVVHGTNFVVPPTRRAAAVMTVHDLTTVHHPELCTPATRRYPSLVRRALARGAWVHTPSDFVGAEVVEVLGADPARVVTVHPGIPPAPPGDPAAGRRLAGAERYVLSVGTVEPRKDLPALVRAFDRVAGDDGDLALVIAGADGWGADALTGAIEAAAHRSRIRRLGWVDDGGRAALLAGAAVLAYPSRYEGFGFPPLEAMAAGVPVVATAAGSVPEVVGSGAALVPVGDVDSLAAALAAVTSDGDRAAALAAAGRARASEFGWDACVDGLVDLYRRAAG